MFSSESHLADRPEPTRFIGDDVRKLFREKELRTVYAPNAARFWEDSVQIVRTFLRENVIAGSPYDSRRHSALLESLLDPSQWVWLQRDGVGMNLRFTLWRTHEGSQVIIYRLISWISAKGVSLSAKPFRRTCKSLIGDPGNKPFVHERSGARHLDHRQERGWRAVCLHIAVRQEQGSDALRKIGRAHV